MEFCKKLLIADYAVLLLLILLFLVPSIDKTNLALVIVAWIAQIAVSSGFYFWKAKAENLVKLPLYMLEHLPEDMKEKADPNQIIASIIGIGHN
jgi:hypothetical protein